ncbi:MAG: hypothetical protein ACRC46_15345 [Thermoguttaceae bacterium]
MMVASSVVGDAALCPLCGRLYPYAETWVFLPTKESICDGCAHVLVAGGHCGKVVGETLTFKRSVYVSSFPVLE